MKRERLTINYVRKEPSSVFKAQNSDLERLIKPLAITFAISFTILIIILVTIIFGI